MLSLDMENKQGLFLYFSKLFTWRGMWTLIFEWKLVKMKFLPSMKSFGNLLRKVFSNS